MMKVSEMDSSVPPLLHLWHDLRALCLTSGTDESIKDGFVCTSSPTLLTGSSHIVPYLRNLWKHQGWVRIRMYCTSSSLDRMFLHGALPLELIKPSGMDSSVPLPLLTGSSCMVPYLWIWCFHQGWIHLYIPSSTPNRIFLHCALPRKEVCSILQWSRYLQIGTSTKKEVFMPECLYRITFDSYIWINHILSCECCFLIQGNWEKVSKMFIFVEALL